MIFSNFSEAAEIIKEKIQRGHHRQLDLILLLQIMQFLLDECRGRIYQTKLISEICFFLLHLRHVKTLFQLEDLTMVIYCDSNAKIFSDFKLGLLDMEITDILSERNSGLVFFTSGLKIFYKLCREFYITGFCSMFNLIFKLAYGQAVKTRSLVYVANLSRLVLAYTNDLKALETYNLRIFELLPKFPADYALPNSLQDAFKDFCDNLNQRIQNLDIRMRSSLYQLGLDYVILYIKTFKNSQIIFHLELTKEAMLQNVIKHEIVNKNKQCWRNHLIERVLAIRKCSLFHSILKMTPIRDQTKLFKRDGNKHLRKIIQEILEAVGQKSVKDRRFILDWLFWQVLSSYQKNITNISSDSNKGHVILNGIFKPIFGQLFIAAFDHNCMDLARDSFSMYLALLYSLKQSLNDLGSEYYDEFKKECLDCCENQSIHAIMEEDSQANTLLYDPERLIPFFINYELLFRSIYKKSFIYGRMESSSMRKTLKRYTLKLYATELNIAENSTILNLLIKNQSFIKLYESNLEVINVENHGHQGNLYYVGCFEWPFNIKSKMVYYGFYHAKKHEHNFIKVIPNPDVYVS